MLCAKCHKQKWGKAMGKDVCDTTLLYQNRNETFSKKRERTRIKRKRREERALSGFKAILGNLWVPNAVFFHLLMSVVLQRVEHCWAENGNNGAWVQYFTSWYLRKVPLSQSQKETLGCDMLWSSHWLPCEGLVGPPATQQPAEQLNRKFKNNMWPGPFFQGKWWASKLWYIPRSCLHVHSLQKSLSGVVMVREWFIIFDFLLCSSSLPSPVGRARRWAPYWVLVDNDKGHCFYSI